MYISNLLKISGRESFKTASTVLAEQLIFSKISSPETAFNEKKQMKQLDYRGILGSIAYLAKITGPGVFFLFFFEIPKQCE